MHKLLSTRLGILSVAVFLVGAVTAGAAFSMKLIRRGKPAVGFTMVSKRTTTLGNGGAPYVSATIVRHQKSDGAWQETITYFGPDGSVTDEATTFGQPGRGVFQDDGKDGTLKFISSMPARPSDIPVYDKRNDPNFVRTEKVMGWETEVLRFVDEVDSSAFTEVYYAPALQGLAIKDVSSAGRTTEVTEPVQILIGEPAESAFNAARDLPVSYDRFKEQIDALEAAGRREAAAAMREELKRRQQQ